MCSACTLNDLPPVSDSGSGVSLITGVMTPGRTAVRWSGPAMDGGMTRTVMFRGNISASTSTVSPATSFPFYWTNPMCVIMTAAPQETTTTSRATSGLREM